MPGPRSCDHCGAAYTARRSTSRYCSDACRKRARRASERAAEVVLLPGPVTAATRRELVAAGRLESAFGQVALILATHIDSASTTAQVRAVPALCREHSRCMVAALKDAEDRRGADDPIDVLTKMRKRRDAKRANR